MLALLLLAAGSAFAASGEYVTLTANDTSGVDKYSYFYAGKWSDSLPPHSDADYLVPNGMTLLLPQSYAVKTALGIDGDFIFAGRSLTIADGGTLRCETVSAYWDGYRGNIAELRMEGGSTLFNTQCGNPTHRYWLAGGTMSILSTSAAKAVSILSTNSGDPAGGNLIRIQMARITGGENAYLKLGSRWGENNPGTLEFDSDFSEYRGTVEITDSRITVTNMNASLSNALVKVGARAKLVMNLSTLSRLQAKIMTLDGEFDGLPGNIEVVSSGLNFNIRCAPANGKTEVFVEVGENRGTVRSEDDQYRFFWMANYNVCHEDLKRFGFNTVISSAPQTGVDGGFMQSVVDWNEAGFDHVTRITCDALRASKLAYPRIRKDGSEVSEVIDAANPEFVAAARKVAADSADILALLYGNIGVQTSSEVRDSSCPSFTPAMSNAYFAATGLVVPPEADGRAAPKWNTIAGFPANRVIETTHPVLSFYRWFWQHGDGWNDYQTMIADEFRRAYAAMGRGEPFSMYDPSQREPALWGAGGNVSHLNHWSYLYKRPFNISFVISEQNEMARGCPGQKVITMIQGISYREGLTVTNQVPENAPAWMTARPNARLITTPPDMLREGLWCVLSRRVDGYGYHGWDALWDAVGAGLSSADTTGYTCTNPETRQVINHIQNEVGVPLGPLLKAMPERPSEVALLESYASQILSGSTPFAWAVRDTAIGYLAVAADLAPEVLYEEDITVRGIPENVKVLLMPDCSVLTRGAYEAIAAFKLRGGKIIADGNLCPALASDASLPAHSTATNGATDDENFQNSLALFKAVVNRYVKPHASSIGNHLISHSRLAGDAADAVFVVNDKRVAGDYVGQWGKVLEKGAANSGSVMVNRRAKVVYDLVTHRSVPSRLVGDATIIDVAFTNTDGRVFLACDRVLSPLAISAVGGTVTVTSPDTDVMLPIRIDGIGDGPVYGVVTNGVYSRKFRESDGFVVRSGDLTCFNLACDGEAEPQYVNDLTADYEGKGCVMLTGTDHNSISNCAYHYAGKWSDGLAPHEGADYYVGYGMALEAPMSSAILSDTGKNAKGNYFDGDSLTIGRSGRLHLNNTYTAYVDAYRTVVNDLRLMSGSLIDNRNSTVYPCRLGDGTMTVLADASDPARFVSYGSVITNTMKWVGNEFAAVRLEGAKHVITDDLSNYDGIIIFAPGCEVEFTNFEAERKARIRHDVFDATSGYVTLTGNDSSIISNNSFHYAGKWSDGRAPHSGTNYYVGAGTKLFVPMNSAILSDTGKSGKYNRFDGDSLTIGDGGTLRFDACYTKYVDAYQAAITNLYLLGGATVEKQNVDYPCRTGVGTMYVLSDERNPVNIVSQTGVMTNSMKIVGDKFAVIRVRGRKVVFNADLSRYRGRIIWDDPTEVEFVDGCWDAEGVLPSLPPAYNAANGYVTLKRSEDMPTTETYGFSFDGSGNGVGSWSDGLATHAGTNYYAACGMFLGNNSGKFAGDQLVLGNGGYLRTKVNGKSFDFEDLRGLGGGSFWGLGTNGKTTMTGNLAVYGTADRPFFITGGQTNQTFEIDMKVAGNSTSVIALRSNGAAPCRVEFTGDFSDYHGTVIVSNHVTFVPGPRMETALVEFTPGCSMDVSKIAETGSVYTRVFRVDDGFLEAELPVISGLPDNRQVVVETEDGTTYLSVASKFGTNLIFR